MAQDPLHTVATMPPFDLYTLDEKGAIKLAHRIHPQELVPQLVIGQGAEWGAAANIGALRLEWGRWSALQARVQAVAERQLRTWKAQVYIQMRIEAEGNKAKLTEAAWENAYRVLPEYTKLQGLVEATTESAAAIQEIVQAVASKKEGLRAIATLSGQGA